MRGAQHDALDAECDHPRDVFMHDVLFILIEDEISGSRADHHAHLNTERYAKRGEPHRRGEPSKVQGGAQLDAVCTAIERGAHSGSIIDAYFQDRHSDSFVHRPSVCILRCEHNGWNR